MSEPARLVGVLWEPKPAFQDLAARPRWWVPIILLTVLSVAYLSMFARVVGWEDYIRQQINKQAETNPQLAALSAEQREQALGTSMVIAKYAGSVGAVAGTLILCLVVAAVMLGLMNWLGGAGINFKQSFSITSYSMLPGVISTLLAMVVMALKNPADFDLQNPLPANLGAFLSTQTTPKWLHALAGSIDLFSIWIILLMALGFSIAARRMSYGKALTLVLLPWIVVLLIKMGYAALLG
jgi:hypothetical protein